MNLADAAQQGSICAGIACAALRQLVGKPLICLDEADKLQPDEIAAHAQLLSFVQLLREDAHILLTGGPLALVHDGDLITLDVPARKLHLHVDDAELERRRSAWVAPEPAMHSGYWKLYIDHVLQADEGADLDFLRPLDTKPIRPTKYKVQSHRFWQIFQLN